MDWPSLLISLLGGTSIVGIASAIRYRKENKTLKQNEVATSTVDVQRQEMDLAEMYKDKMLVLLEQVSEKQDNGSAAQEKMLRKLDNLDTRMDGVESRMADVVTYLNGDFQDYLKRTHAPKPRRTKKAE